MMPRITDVVKNLLIINILMYIGTYMLMGQNRALLAVGTPGTDFFKPYQMVTHMFMHADPSHLLFNMFALYMFGTSIERAWGPQRFLAYYLICGFGAMIFSWLLNSEPGFMWGASGAIFGVIAAFGMLFPNQTLSLIFPPISMKAWIFVILYLVVELFYGVRGTYTGIGHFAHIGGAVTGALLILYWRMRAKP